MGLGSSIGHRVRVMGAKVLPSHEEPLQEGQTPMSDLVSPISAHPEGSSSANESGAVPDSQSGNEAEMTAVAIPSDHNALHARWPKPVNDAPLAAPGKGSGSTTICVDLTIQFIGAEGLPRTDPTSGGSDPYFKAVLDQKIDYISTVQRGTMRPIWNEVWHVKNVPENAWLQIKVYDKDDNPLPDDYIGTLEFNLQPTGLRDFEIKGHMGVHHGKFYLNIITTPIKGAPTTAPYTFAGPCRYSRHKSPTVGALTARQTDDRLYATWKVYMMGAHEFFGDTHQHWNEKYPAAKKIFAHDPLGLGIRSIVHLGHRMLYARSTANAFGILNNANDLIQLFKDETKDDRIKPAIYTYIINDQTWRFSETGAVRHKLRRKRKRPPSAERLPLIGRPIPDSMQAFFVDFASKHALHANVLEVVRYSGEFHWRPRLEGGWAGFSEETNDDTVDWELVIDNNSGTYSPDKGMLPKLKEFMEFNFPGLHVVVHDHGDPDLKKSEELLHKYAKERRGIEESEFTAHSKMGETTLMNMAARMAEKLHLKKPQESDSEEDLAKKYRRIKLGDERPASDSGALNA